MTLKTRPVAYLAGVLGMALLSSVLRLELAQRTTELGTPPSSQPSTPRTLRAFTPTSWWNTPLPRDAPTASGAAKILDYLRTGPESGPGCLLLAGSRDSHWGTPIFWAGPTDAEYHVQRTRLRLPAELRSLRIPDGARPSNNNDATMIVYDVDKGYAVALTDAHHNQAADTWSASGATVSYLDSNGLDVGTGRSDERRNTGTHRGNNAPTMVVSWDQVQQGAVNHVLKIASGPSLADRYVFPMTGSDGKYNGSDPAVPPAGLRLRIKPTVDLERLDLAPDALVIARAIQRYGVYLGDSGGRTALKLENTEVEGRGELWNVERDGLCTLPFTPAFWDVVAEGYDPSAPQLPELLLPPADQRSTHTRRENGPRRRRRRRNKTMPVLPGSRCCSASRRSDRSGTPTRTSSSVSESSDRAASSSWLGSATTSGSEDAG